MLNDGKPSIQVTAPSTLKNDSRWSSTTPRVAIVQSFGIREEATPRPPDNKETAADVIAP